MPPTQPTQRTVLEDRDQPKPVAPLGLVLGFVTEFNANVQVFNTVAGLILTTALKTSELEGTASRLNSDVAGLKSRMTLLEAGVKLQNEEPRRRGYNGSTSIAED